MVSVAAVVVVAMLVVDLILLVWDVLPWSTEWY